MKRFLPLVAVLTALFVSLGSVTAVAGCAVTGPTPAVAAASGCDTPVGEHRTDAAADCQRHCAVLCRAIPSAAPEAAAAGQTSRAAYAVALSAGVGLAPAPERPPPR